MVKKSKSGTKTVLVEPETLKKDARPGPLGRPFRESTVTGPVPLSLEALAFAHLNLRGFGIRAVGLVSGIWPFGA